MPSSCSAPRWSRPLAVRQAQVQQDQVMPPRGAGTLVPRQEPACITWWPGNEWANEQGHAVTNDGMIVDQQNLHGVPAWGILPAEVDRTTTEPLYTRIFPRGNTGRWGIPVVAARQGATPDEAAGRSAWATGHGKAQSPMLKFELLKTEAWPAVAASHSTTAWSRRPSSCRWAPMARSGRDAPVPRGGWAQIILGNTFHLWLRPGT